MGLPGDRRRRREAASRRVKDYLNAFTQGFLRTGNGPVDPGMSGIGTAGAHADAGLLGANGFEALFVARKGLPPLRALAAAVWRAITGGTWCIGDKMAIPESTISRRLGCGEKSLKIGAIISLWLPFITC